jgi:hypothetical protein
MRSIIFIFLDTDAEPDRCKRSGETAGKGVFMLLFIRKKLPWIGTAIAVLALFTGLSLIACSQPNDPVSNPTITNAQTPSITTQPQSGNFDVADETHVLSVTAGVTDGGTLSYQWYENATDSNTGGTAKGGNSNTLTLNADDYTNNEYYYYYVEVKNTNNGATGNKTATSTSAVAQIKVNGVGGEYDAEQPEIETHPQDGTWDVSVNAQHVLTVVAEVEDGGTLSYQWYSNTTASKTGGSPIGTDSTTLTLNKTNYPVDGDYYFYVVVTNTNDEVSGDQTADITSDVATVTVTGNVSAPDTGPLSDGVWRDGTFTDTISSMEYTFDVEDGKTYYVWWNGRDFGPTPKDKNMDIRVSAKYSEETTAYLFGGEGYGGINDGWANSRFFPANRNGSVTLIVTPYNSASSYGSFAVAFSTISLRPGAAVPSGALSENQWKDNTISADAIHVYTMNVTHGTEYFFWWNETGYGYGDGTKSANIQVQARYADDTLIFNEASLYADQWAEVAWATPTSFTADITGTVNVRVRPYNGSATSVGTYGIVYSTGNTMPVKDSAELRSVTANGGSGASTTALTLLFDKVVNGLSASDITLSMPGSLFGVTKGDLSGTGPEYTLGVSSPTNGTVTVTMGSTLLQITGSPKTVNIYGDDSIIPSLVENQWTDGELLTGDSIDWYKIAVTAGTTYYVWWNDGYDGDDTKDADVVVGAFRANGSLIFGGTDTSVDHGWENSQTIASSATDGTVYVRVHPYLASSGNTGTYGITYSTVNTRPGVIDIPGTPVTFSSVTANGTSGTPTTALTLVFSEAIPGLSAADITLTMVSPFGVTKGALSGAGPSYTLVVGSPIDGILTVKVQKKLYDISGSTKEVNIYGGGSITVTPLVVNQWADGELLYGNSVDWYAITVSAGTTYYVWWNDSYGGDDTKDADVVVGARYADGTNIFGDDEGYEEDSGWYESQEFTAEEDGTVYLRVVPYSELDSCAGTYGIAFSTSDTRP